MKLLKCFYLTSLLAGGQFIPSIADAQWDSSLNTAPLPNMVRPQKSNSVPGAAFSVLSTISHGRTTAQSSHVVSLSDGNIQGKIMQLDENPPEKNQAMRANLKIFLMREGQIVHQTESSSNGSFLIENVQPGTYSFVATGDVGFTAYGVVVTEQEGGGNVLEGAAVSHRTAGLKEILDQRLPPQIIRHITSQPVSLPAAAGVAGSSRVRLIRGQLNGSVRGFDSAGDSIPVQGTIVNLIKDGQRVSDVEVEEDGSFVIADLEPGIYDFIGVGHKSIAALRFEAVDQDSPMSTVSFKKPKLIATTLDVVLTSPQDSQLISQSVQETSLDSNSQLQTSYANQSSSAGAGVESQAQNVGVGGAQGPYFYQDGAVSFPAGGGGSRGGRIFGGGRLPIAGGIALGIIGVSRNPRAASPSQ